MFNLKGINRKRFISVLLIIFSLSLYLPIMSMAATTDDVSTLVYNGSPSIELNNNTPVFGAEDITTQSFEQYGKLDKLGRCTVAIASIGKDLMPTEERGSIGTIKPTGWKQNKYPGIVDSQPPYLITGAT